jgi:predicted nucleic acid-binding protein
VSARAVLVDSNVLIDLLGADSPQRRWSVDALEREGEVAPLVINPIIYAEVSAGFDRIEDLDAAVPASVFHREPLPWAGGFLAARAHLEYRRRGGPRTAVLADFFIGAHAAVGAMALLTRDPRVYRRYFRGLELIAPDSGTYAAVPV